jgi:glutaredoxin
MKKAVFYHAGCAVCVAAEELFVSALDPTQYQVEVVHLGLDKSRILEAETIGVKSVPALAIDNIPFHINFGASLNDVKAA